MNGDEPKNNELGLFLVALSCFVSVMLAIFAPKVLVAIFILVILSFLGSRKKGHCDCDS